MFALKTSDSGPTLKHETLKILTHVQSNLFLYPSYEIQCYQGVLGKTSPKKHKQGAVY